MKHLILSIFILFTSFTFAQEENLLCRHFDELGRTRERVVDFESMTLHIDFDVEHKKVLGKVKYQFTPIRKSVPSFTLDAPGIIIKDVLLDNKKCSFKQNDEDLELVFDKDLSWDNNYELEIIYETQPEKGLYFLGWQDSTNRARKQIWTQGQGVDNRYWIPSFDDVSDKLVTETYITFQNGFEVISNGDLIEKIPAGNNKTTWHYKMKDPHILYLVMITIGEYEYKDLISKSGITLRQYYYKEHPEQFDYTYQHSAEMMDWMENEFGVAYPWGNIYRNVPVADFLYGAMENTTATVFTDFYLRDSRTVLERDYIGTNAHELTHQWFGNYITEWNSTSHWLHESFATQYAKHFKKSLSTNTDEYEWERYQEMLRALSADDKNDTPIAHSKAGSAKHYPKGSFIIDMLRNAAGGEEQFQKVITNYLKRYSFKNVDSHLLQLEFMETLGLNLDWFFDQWIYKGGYPHYEFLYNEEKETLTIKLFQNQDHTNTVGYFKTQAEIYLAYDDGTGELLNIENVDSAQSISIKNLANKTISYINFDVGNKIYKKLSYKRTPEELIALANSKEAMIDRYLALQELEEVELKIKRKALQEIYKKETFHATKGSIIKQLADDDNKKSKQLLLEALKENHHLVRRAVLDNTEFIEPKDVHYFETLLVDSSFVNIEKALIKLSAQFPDKTLNYLTKTKLDASKNTDLKITWLKVAIENGDESLIDELIDFSSQSFEFRTRLKAMRAINNLQLLNNNYLENLINASVSFNRYLSASAARYLNEITLNETYKTTLFKIIDSQSFDVNEQKRIDQLIEEFK